MNDLFLSSSIPNLGSSKRNMFWSVILPFQVTCAVLLIAVIVLTAFASPKNWSRIKTLSLYSGVALFAFIPSCIGITMAVDSVRFGDFVYGSYNEIPDFRSRRYLPEVATDITIRKHENGYLARYNISASEFSSYLDELWNKYGELSAVERGEFSDEGEFANPEKFDMTFGDLGWNCPSNAIIYYSPMESDGGGATYYVDSYAGLVFQETGFW